MKKRILSVFIAILFVMNCFPLSVIAEFEEDSNVIEVFLEDDFADNIDVDDKEYNGEVTATVDCKNVKLRNVLTLEEIKGYSVWLSADGEFENENASDDEKKVVIKNFRLEGDDKDNFKLVREYDEVEKYAYITPSEISLDEDFESKIKVNDKEFDGSRTAEVDCSEVLNIKRSEYDVYLAADGEFENENASADEKTVVIKNFRLEGNDKDNFKLVGEYNGIEKYAYINPAKIFLEKGFENKIKVNSKEFDGSKMAEVDCSEVLNIDRSEYDVYLVADGEFENENVSNAPQKVIIENFRLEGNDKDNFNLIGEYDKVVKYVNINPKELIVTPNEKSMYYGQQRPEFTYTIKPSDINNVNLTVDVNCSDNIIPIGKYNYTVESEDLNYSAKIAENCVFTVEEFNTDKRAIIENESKIYHDDIIKLEAPLGYLIGVDGVNFNTETYVTLQETQNGEKKEFSYYLRYNVNDTSGYYGAISQKISYEYSCVLDQKEPSITYINIRKTEIGSLLSDSPIKMFSFGNYTNNEIEFIIKAKDLSYTNYISGIRSVTLYDYDEKTDSRSFFGEFEKKESQIIDDEEIWEYVLKTQPNKIGNANVSIKDMLICVTDNKGNEYSKRVLDEIKLHFENDSNNFPDEYLRTMESNSLVVENEPPKVHFCVSNSFNNSKTVEEESFKYNSDNKIWYNINDVLSFGTYSNDTLIFKAYVSDADFDSGIDCVKIIYDGLDSEKEMTDEGNGVYSWVISNDTKIFQSDIIVTAYDKYGKNSLNCPNIENAEQGKGVSDNVFAMIETEKPEVTISSPKGDGIVRTDKQIWFNSNKDIGISVYDKDSGIRNIDIKVNGIDVTVDKNSAVIPKTSATESTKERDNERHIYAFDTDYFTGIAGEPEDGKYIISVEVTDNAGNVNSEESFTYYIDKNSPIVDRFEFLPETSDNISETSEYIEYLEYGYYFKKDFIANIHVSDSAPTSGLNKVEYRLVSYDSGELKEEKTGEAIISDGIAPIDIPAGFKGQIFVKAFDNVGNYSDEETPKAFVADDTPPEITISGIGESRYSDANGNKLFTDDISVNVTITDTKSGIREIGYYQTSENDGFERRVIEIDGTSVEIDSDIGDGWIVTNKDVNLVTEITKTFIFDKDNNDIMLAFDAMDNSGNVNEIVQSETITIDKTDPIINVDINSGINDTIYYNAGNRAVITIDVIERNFDAGLIQAAIENAYNGNVPNISFQDLSETEHRAVVTFSEGDYTFNIRGTDLGGHSAEVNLDYEKVRRFYVDETSPVVEENFSDFINRDKDNYLNTEKTAVIKITEHNFDPNLAGLKIMKKDAGTEHNENDFTDVTYSMVSMADWSDDNDTHTLSIKFDDDAVYRIEISPSDPSGNTSDYRSSEIFEIDTTLPVISAKNGNLVDEKNAVEFLDIYPYERKDEAAPTVEFTDVNFDYIRYSLTVYTPEYTNGRELSEVKPVSIYLDSDKDKSGIFEKNLFTLPNFSKDGVYALELIAVDKAGNESVLNSNTYMRMVDSDVLAYISNSNAAKKTGWYSFQYENGDPISKRPDNFSDIDIVVLARNDSPIDIVLRDYNGDEKNTDLQAETDNSMYGVSVYRYTLKSDYFKENFQDDTDAELYLSVKNENGRIDLGKMHIDNIPPSCTLPDDLKSWNWYFGDDSRTITITNISELLDETKCKVYDNGKEIDFTYSETDGSLSFTLNGGWHNVGITLEDVAGNTYSIQEVDNIHIGYFWLWIILIASVIFIGIIILIIYIVRKRRYS